MLCSTTFDVIELHSTMQHFLPFSQAYVRSVFLLVTMAVRYLRVGVCRPCVETKLTATEKSATDGDWSVTTLGRHMRAYDRIQLVADNWRLSRMFNFYDQLPINGDYFYQDAGDISVLTTAINCISKVADQRKLSRRVDIS